MRSYPHNSPEAAARIVALVLISDGHVCSSEFDILKQLGAERELGLEPQLLPHIVHTLREELLAGGYETGSLMANVDDSTLASLMAEVSDPALQRTMLRLSLAAARADGHLADGEADGCCGRLATIGGWLTARSQSLQHPHAAKWPDRHHASAFRGAPQPPPASPRGGAGRGVSGWRGSPPARRRNGPGAASRASTPRQRRRSG